MSMDVYGNLTLVARPKQKLPLKEDIVKNVKKFKEKVANLPDENFDSYFQNLLNDFCPKLHRYNYEEDDTLDIKINSSENLEFVDILDLGLYDNVGPNDGYPFKEIFEKDGIKIYDENIASDEPPYITKEGEKDSFHLGYDNYGNFLYLMTLDNFHKNIDSLNENGYFMQKLEKLDTKYIEEMFNKTKETCLKNLEQYYKDFHTDEDNYKQVRDKWSKQTYLDYDFYVAFEGYIC